MPTREYPDVPPDFGHWLAGFIDGEGYFGINRGRNKGCPAISYRPIFKVALRGDDRAILVEIVERTGIGRVNDDPRGDGLNPQSQWTVSGKANCVQLAALLDRYPLRAKKARDFAIWREAVAEWQALRQWGRQPADWSRIAPLRDALMGLRDFDSSVPVIEREPTPPALFEEAS